MALNGERLASLLAYCRIEEPTAEELLTLEGLYDAAVGYLERAGVAEPAAGTTRRAQYDLCVNFIVLRDFDLRDAEVSGRPSVACSPSSSCPRRCPTRTHRSARAVVSSPDGPERGREPSPAPAGWFTPETKGSRTSRTGEA